MNELDVTTDLSTCEVQVRTVVRSPRTPTFQSPETVDWMTGSPCTVTRDEYAGAVRA